MYEGVESQVLELINGIIFDENFIWFISKLWFDCDVLEKKYHTVVEPSRNHFFFLFYWQSETIEIKEITSSLISFVLCTLKWMNNSRGVHYLKKKLEKFSFREFFFLIFINSSFPNIFFSIVKIFFLHANNML